MAVVEVLETTEGVEGGASLDSGGKFTRTYLVTFSGINKYPYAATNATDGTITVPSYGAVHPDESTVYVIEKTARPAEGGGGWHWNVTVSYGRPSVSANASASPDDPGDDGASGSGSPPATATESTSIEWGTWSRTEAPTTDLLGTTFKNSVGDLIDPPPTKEDENLQITYTRTQSSFSPLWLKRLNNRINFTSFSIGGLSFAAKTLKCKISAKYPAGSSGGKWQVTITIQHDPNGWDWSLLDAGFYRLTGGGTRARITDGPFEVTKPRLLDGAGGQLAIGGTPVYIPFRKYYYADFAYLGLDY